MKRICLGLIILLAILELFSYPVKITSWQLKEDVKRLNLLNISIDNVNPNTQTIIAYVRNDIEFNLIRANGFRAETLPDTSKDYADSLWLATKDSDNPLRDYYTLDQYHTFMSATAAQYPDICQLVQFGTSVQDRPLYMLKISDNVSMQENEPEFRYVSSIHGNEVVGYDILIRLIQLLTSEYTTDVRITNIVNNTEIWICPMLNPDGFVAHARYNANGIDLNRNFPLPVGSQHPDGQAWQPETIAFMNHAQANNVILSANYHGGALVVNYPWDYTYTLAPDNDILIQAALTYSSHNDPMYNSSVFPQGITNGAEWYVATGTLQDWCYGYNGDMDFTIEVSEVMWPNESQLDTFWAQNEESALSLLEFAQRGVHGTVTNFQGNPLSASISINTAGVDIFTDPDVGDYHRILLPGTYSLSAYSEGYSISTAEVTLALNGTVTQNFVLEPVIYTDFTATVIDLQGFPVTNASGNLIYGSSEFDFQTNTQGTFSLINIPSGNFDILIEAPGYGSIRNTVQISAENNRQVFILPQPLFIDDFESGISNWNVQSPWAISTLASTQVLTDSPLGNYGNNRNINATIANPVNLQNIVNPTLSFEIKYDLETNYDYLYVQISTNGTNWTTIAEYTGEDYDWETALIALNDYTDLTIYFRFKLSTDYSVTADGVYIDNVAISGLSSAQIVYGDVNSNWISDLWDVQFILEYSVGNNPIPEIDSYPWDAFRIEAADVDNDNQITSTDSYYIYSKYNLYDSPYPAQGGESFQFNNPQIEIPDYTGNMLSIFANNYNDLNALTLNFASDPDFEITSLNWNHQLENVLTASSADNKSVSLLAFSDATLYGGIADILFQSDSPLVHVTGLANDVDVNLNVDCTSSDDDFAVPYITSLLGNFPNPFNPNTSINFTLANDDTPVQILVFNLKGQMIKTIIKTTLSKGSHSVFFDGTDDNQGTLASGIYYYKLVLPQQSFTGKMVLLK